MNHEPLRPSRPSSIPVLLAVVLLAGAAPAEEPVPPLVESVVDAPSASSMAAWHELLGERPHVAGTDGDMVVIEALAGAFEGMGLETETWWFEPLLARPVAASLTIVEPDAGEGATPETGRRRRGISTLPLTEKELLEDPATAHPDLGWGWNAYSGSGVVEAEVVYANRGRLEDFERLRELGIDCTGKIVFARYGGNYRGFKVKFAEEAGAAGVVIFLDPGDYGDDRGPTWPEGGWANETCIQRGSIVTLPYKGDPLTPFEPARGDVERLDVDSVGLPSIPVQPIGYGAANRIMAAMTGPDVAVMGLDGWTGGLDVPYRLESGGLRLRLEVEQVRELRRTANVFGILPGAERPEEFVIVGGHHDAWGFGAADPLAGTIVVMEVARAFAEAAERGLRPRRSIVFAGWGAEEFGIIGSCEWVEAELERIRRHAVAYINLDMAALGTRFGASASPSLHDAIARATGLVPQPGADGTVRRSWQGDRDRPPIGDLGGGSDHVGFVCHAGVPSASFGARGSAGSVHHSNYDTLAWYRSTVGDDYEGAIMLARITGALVAELADAPVPPLDPTTGVARFLEGLARHEVAAEESGLRLDLDTLRSEAMVALAACEAAGSRLREGDRDGDAATASLLRFERTWIDEGLPGRPWFRNEFSASDRDSGYGAVVLPRMAEAIRDGDQAALDEAVARYRTLVGRTVDAANRIAP
ncbi:MAG: M28 family peptidase [Planctomycetota bacterium]|nr:M28 family peptidase [Planctomycetota bacterium]